MSRINNQGSGLGQTNAPRPPHHTRALLSSECRHLVLEPILVGLPYHGGSQEESARMVSSKEQVLARDESVPALSSALPDTCWARRKGRMMT